MAIEAKMQRCADFAADVELMTAARALGTARTEADALARADGCRI